MTDHPRRAVQLNLRLDPLIYTLLQEKASESGVPQGLPGRIGGVTEYVRQLIYNDLELRLMDDPHALRGRELVEFNRVRNKYKRT